MKHSTHNKTIPVLASMLICSLLTLQVPAQLSLGMEGGIVKNYLVTNNANRNFTNYQPGMGMTLAIPVQYKMTSWFAIAIDPGMVQKNYSQVRSGYFEGVYEKSSNTYLQLPLMAHLMFGGKKLQGFVNTGAYAGYWISSNLKGTIPNIMDISNSSVVNNVFDIESPYQYDEKYTFKSQDHRFEAGVVAGMGISYHIKKWYEIFSEARILYSLTDRQKNYMTGQQPQYNTTYGINVGLLVTPFTKNHPTNSK